MKKKAKKKIYKYLYFSIALICLLFGIYKYINNYLNKDSLLKGPYYVTHVIDGDTIMTNIDSKSIKIRIIGIDTPESAASEDSDKINTHEGEIATARAKQLLENKYVYIEYDKEKYDKYGRMLAYVYFDDKKTMYEDIILSEGLAISLQIEPNIKYQKQFESIQNKAKDNKTGFWETGFYE